MMRPYRGKHYGDTGIPRLLLIGESYYVPPGSKLNRSGEAWYAGSSDILTETERGFIDTTELIEDSRSEGFSNKAHSIWRNSFSEINQFGPGYSDFKRVADDIAYYNFFLRPALTGVSLEVTSQDVEIANEAFVMHCETLKPTGIVFLSRLACSHCRLPESISIPVVATPHPSCRWWNRAAKCYGNKRGRDILGEFIKKTNWPTMPDSK